MVVQSAKETGAMTVAVTNNPESPLARMCDYHIDLAAGVEHSVGATKSFLAALTAMYMLSNALSPVTAKMNVAELAPLLEDFIAGYKDSIKAFAEETKDINNYIILTRGLCQCVASELSLKMMESCYKFTRPLPDSEFTEEFISMTTRLNLLGANIISFTDIKDVELMSAKTLRMPTGRGMHAPFIYSI